MLIQKQQQQPVTSENHGTIPIDREGRRSDLDNGRLSDTKVQDGTERDNLKSVLNADSGRTYVRSAEKGELTGRARRAKEVWTFEDKRLERWKNDIANIFLFVRRHTLLVRWPVLNSFSIFRRASSRQS